MLIRFILYGLLGWAGEIVWTSVHEKVAGRQQGWSLRGTTYLWMFPIYGLIAPLYEPAHNRIRERPIWARGLLYMSGFFGVEYAAGWLLRRLTGACPWDYTERSRWHVDGLIRLGYAPVWFSVGLLLEPVHDFLVRLTPAISRELSRGRNGLQ